LFLLVDCLRLKAICISNSLSHRFATKTCFFPLIPIPIPLHKAIVATMGWCTNEYPGLSLLSSAAQYSTPGSLRSPAGGNFFCSLRFGFGYHNSQLLAWQLRINSLPNLFAAVCYLLPGVCFTILLPPSPICVTFSLAFYLVFAKLLCVI